MKGLRYGLHVNENYATDRAIDYCARVKPAVMKWLDPAPDIIRRCKEVSPTTEHIGRVVFSPQNNSDDYRVFINRTLDRARDLRGLVKWHEGWNEHIPNDASPSRIKEFAGLEVEFAKAMNAIGVGALIGGFSTGTLDAGKIDAFGDAFRYMQGVGPDRCALHAHYYGGGYMALNVKTPDGKNQWPDGGSFTGWTTDPSLYDDPTLRGWLFLRHRDLRPLLLARGWDKVTLYITESGVDAVHKNPGGRRGWRDYRGTEWERLPGMGDFANQMRWAAVQLGHDDWVRGAVDFGFAGARSGWADFDLNEDHEMLERFIVAQQSIPLVTSAPVPTPIPPRPSPTPTPLPTPLPTLRPRVTAAVGVFAVPAPGEGAAAFAGRAAGWPEAPFGKRAEWAREIAGANNLATSTFAAGRAYRLPASWFAAREV